jgi:TolB-like protein/Tfp pilus assembly protein PilF
MASVWGELKRRNVVRVAVAYAIAAWLLIEITATTFPILKLPDWSVTLVTVLVLIGFPLALILAWAFELTPEGIKKEKDVDRSESITHVTGRKLDFAIIGVLAITVVYFVAEKFIWSDELAPDSQVDASIAVPQEIDKSIAVLPFVNMSADPEQEYFSDGIAEEILNGLVKVPGLRVVARTSAFSFKGQNIDIREVGETLNANHVLEGSVRKAGDRLRITAQLISVHDGYHLWSETFDRKTDDVFAIQDEIARAVVSALEITLGLAEETPLVSLGTTNTDAYNWFLRGNYYIGRQSPEAFDKAIESYAKAVELDPEFAGGHGGYAYGLAYGSFFYPYSQVSERVRKSYERALQIDEYQIEALMAKAVDAALTDYNFVAAEQAIRKALTVEPNNTLIADAYWFLILTPQRRFDETLALLANAERADPLSSLIQQGIGANLWWKGDNQASLHYAEAAIELNPNDTFATFVLINVYVELGRLEKAESTIVQLESLMGTNAWSLAGWVALHIAREDKISAQQALERMVAIYNEGNEDPTLVPYTGVAYVRLGNIEEAIDWFERAAESPGPATSISTVMVYKNSALWNHPRFQTLLQKMNLDNASVAAAKAAVASQ